MQLEFLIIIVLIVINIIGVAVTAGRVQQKVKDLCGRVDRIEKFINGQMPKG